MLKRILKLLLLPVAILLLLVIYPIWFLFATIINLTNRKYARVINGKLQTPVVFYEHPVTKRIVVFVSTIHIAEQSYYAALYKLISSLEGYKILFEGVGKLTPEEKRALKKKEKEISLQFDFIFRLIRKISEMLSLQGQKEGLFYPPSWINTDIRQSELIRLFVEQNITLIKREKQFEKLLRKKSNRSMIKWTVNKLLINLTPILVLSLILRRNKRAEKKLILDHRNIIAVMGINEYLKDSNIVTIWGAAHLPGIEKELLKNGFRKFRKEWFTAYTDRNYSIFDSFKK